MAINEDETLKYQMSSHSSRSLNFQIEDVKNLSLYIQNVSTNINNIDVQLNKRKNNKSFVNSNEIINESENDDEIKAPSSLDNPFSRNMLFKRYSTVLFSTSFTKEKIINQSLLNKTSITEDSGREGRDMIMMKKVPIPSKEKTPQVIQSIEDKQRTNKSNHESLIKLPLKTQTLPFSKKDFHKLLHSQKISKQQSKTIFEEFNSINQKEAIHQRNKRVKSQMTSSLIQEHNKRVNNNKQIKTNPFCLTIPSVALIKKKNLVINNSIVKPIQTFGKLKYSTNRIDSNQPKTILFKQTNKKPIEKKETLKDMHKFKSLNDKEFAEMYLLYSELNILNKIHENTNDTNGHLDDYFNEMKTSYSIRNSDTYKKTPFSKAYLEDKSNKAVLRIQRHWRQWKVNKLIRSTYPTIPRPPKQSQSEAIRNAKIHIYMEILKTDKDFKEMVSYISKATECYTKCLKSKLFEKSKNMILNDFIIENSKGELNELSNIINLNLQLKKKPIRSIKTNKKILKR